MANRERGELSLVTPTHTYTLRLTVGTCCELEDRTGQDFDVLSARLVRGRITELRLLLWAALRPYHAADFPEPESLDDLIDAFKVKAIRALLRTLLVLNVNDDPAKDEDGKAVEDDRPGSIWRRLYLDARCSGMPGDVFWNLSLLELWRELAAARQRAKAERDRDLTQAWWIAALVWQKKLPELSTLIDAKPKRAAAQTWQDIKAQMTQFSAVHNARLQGAA